VANGRGCKLPANSTGSTAFQVAVSVSQAKPGSAMRVGRCRLRQMRPRRRQNQTITGNRAELRMCDLLHGVDQHRQPQLLAIGRPSPNSPYLKLLSHRKCSCLSADPSPIRKPPTGSRNSCPKPDSLPQRIRAGCDLLHKSPDQLGLNRWYDREITPALVRSAERHRHRLCADRHRHRGRLGRASLPHSGLMQRQTAGQHARVLPE
jgi:hypothetical protein